MVRALAARVELVLRPGAPALVVVLAVAGLRVHDLRLPHQPLRPPQAPAHSPCQKKQVQ